MSEIKLNPCPKCKSTHVMLYDETLYAYHVKCFDCGLDIKESYEFRRYGSAKVKYEIERENESNKNAKKRVVDRWNRGDIKKPQRVPSMRWD